MIVLLVMVQEFYCTNTREYINIPPCSGKLVFDFSRLQEGIFVYSLVKLYNKANFMFGMCMAEVIKPSCQGNTSELKLIFILHNRLNVPQNFKENHTIKHTFL